jgi:hypothetical protein
MYSYMYIIKSLLQHNKLTEENRKYFTFENILGQKEQKLPLQSAGTVMGWTAGRKLVKVVTGTLWTCTAS